jgi:hypothetical protein
MKKRIFTIVALATILGLLVTGTAAAGSNRTAFSGTSTLIDEPGVPERYWEPGRNVAFWRGMPFIFMIETTDLRVNGMVCVSHNGNYRPSPDDLSYGVQGQMWGTVSIAGYRDDRDCSKSLDYWEGSFVGDRASDGSEHLRYNLKGYGAYAGLQLRMEERAGTFDPYFTVSGEVLNPGKK